MPALVVTILLLFPQAASAFLPDSEIKALQEQSSHAPLGERIALWAEQFVGTPYDPDPDGEYVTRRAIVADDRVDCMYLVFRAVELALSNDPEEAVRVALDRRFMHAGRIEQGAVVNYEDRFRYGEDMIESGKWGREITGSLGRISFLKGSRKWERVAVLSGANAEAAVGLLKTGDLVFFVHHPEKRSSDEIVGHMGIVRKTPNGAYLIHAGGLKNKGGRVKKVLFSDYLKSMPFAGIRVSRFETDSPTPE